MNKLEKRVIRTDNAPAAIGPYSAGIVAGKFVFTAGQIGLNPENGQMVEGGVKEQARRALTNLKAILEAAGSSLENVVKTTVFLQDMADFTKVNEVYAEFFTANPPARSAVQVAALPKNARVEIEAIALLLEY
jgi:2-iminobutanoate/2-iminopropanoate deaminase